MIFPTVHFGLLFYVKSILDVRRQIWCSFFGFSLFPLLLVLIGMLVQFSTVKLLISKAEIKVVKREEGEVVRRGEGERVI